MNQTEEKELVEAREEWRLIDVDDTAILPKASRLVELLEGALGDTELDAEYWKGKYEALQEREDRRTGKRRDCEICGEPTPFPGAVYCCEKCWGVGCQKKSTAGTEE